MISHELNETITDPNAGNGGWSSSSTGNTNTQMADFCQWTPSGDSTALGHTYTVSTAFGTATANFHGADGDFLIQSLRVNGGGGTEGYCVNSYGGLFWGQNFGLMWSPIPDYGDWSPGNYKGECAPGQPLIGLSQYTSGAGQAHAVMCGSTGTSGDFPQSQSCETLNFGGSNGGVQWYSDPAPVGDWASGFFKGECSKNQFVAGVGQSQSGGTDALLCCPGSVGHNSCNAQPFSSGNMANSSTPYDWDYGYYKAECNNGQYVAGVSVAQSNGAPHSILCCSP